MRLFITKTMIFLAIIATSSPMPCVSSNSCLPKH